MNRTEIISLCGLALVALGAVFTVGVLHGRVSTLTETLNPEAVLRARNEAIDAIKEARDARQFIAATESWTWHQGADPVQLIRVDEGICYLVRVAGWFRGGGEAVSIVPRGDYWFLEGQSGQSGVQAVARCWKFPSLNEEPLGPAN